MTLKNIKCGKISVKRRNIFKWLFNGNKKYKIKVLFDGFCQEINTQYFKSDKLLIGVKKEGIPKWITKKQDEVFESVYHNYEYDYSLFVLKKFFASSSFSTDVQHSEEIEIKSVYCKPDTDEEVLIVISYYDNGKKYVFAYDSKEFDENDVGVIIEQSFNE